MKESLRVLQECAELQTKKSQDYQSSESTVVQAMHYRRGIDTIHDIILGKMMRATSLLEYSILQRSLRYVLPEYSTNYL